MQRDATTAIGRGDCPRGVAQSKLDGCLADIRNERCDNALDAIARVATCSSANLWVAE